MSVLKIITSFVRGVSRTARLFATLCQDEPELVINCTRIKFARCGRLIVVNNYQIFDYHLGGYFGTTEAEVKTSAARDAEQTRVQLLDQVREMSYNSRNGNGNGNGKYSSNKDR